MIRYCCQCDRYIMSKTAWPDGKGGYVRTDPAPGCSAEGKEYKRIRADDPPCDTATFEVMDGVSLR